MREKVRISRNFESNQVKLFLIIVETLIRRSDVINEENITSSSLEPSEEYNLFLIELQSEAEKSTKKVNFVPKQLELESEYDSSIPFEQVENFDYGASFDYPANQTVEAATSNFTDFTNYSDPYSS